MRRRSLSAKNNHRAIPYANITGFKIAMYNMGASQETESGLYFQWGDPKGYSIDNIGIGTGQKPFGWNDYIWTDDGGSTMSKYNITDGKTSLDDKDNPVKVAYGNKWRMLTLDEYTFLFGKSYTTHNWINDHQDSGINGLQCSDGDASIFIPAVDDIEDGINVQNGEVAIWVNEVNTENYNLAKSYRNFNGSGHSQNDYRNFGLPIRAVKQYSYGGYSTALNMYLSGETYSANVYYKGGGQRVAGDNNGIIATLMKRGYGTFASFEDTVSIENTYGENSVAFLRTVYKYEAVCVTNNNYYCCAHDYGIDRYKVYYFTDQNKYVCVHNSL